MPAAAHDDAGRLHVAWYDTTDGSGRLLYAHSVTSDLVGAYIPPVVVDAEACPGDRWYPYSSQADPPGGRRLREYIDMAVDDGRVFVTWTHAPVPPATVYAATIDPQPATKQQ